MQKHCNLHLFSNRPGGVLYKTGDLARYLADGNIEFLGRADQQVKIRGFRVEPGEIEVVLTQHPAVQEAVILSIEDEPIDKRLVAYVVLKKDKSPKSVELRRYLRTNFPDYMVPSTFVFLEALPLTPTGKVDRRALPTPDLSRPELESTFVSPKSTLDKKIAGIWSELFGIEKIGIYDNFFKLGGHSLLATRLINRILDVFQVRLPLKALWESPTIAEMAVAILQAKAGRLDEQEFNRILVDL